MNPPSSLTLRHTLHGSFALMGMAAGLIFVMDLMHPLDVGGGVPYIAVVLLSLRHRNRQLPVWTAVGCSTLTLIGIFFASPVEEWGNAIIIRVWALLAIWTTALLVQSHQQLAGIIVKQEKNRLLTGRIFESSPDHISIIGSDYRFRLVNEAYNALQQLSAGQLIENHVAEVFGAQVFAETIKPNMDPRCFRGKENTS